MKKRLSLSGLSVFLLSYGGLAVAQSLDPGSLSPATIPTVSPIPNPGSMPDCGPIDRVPTLPPDRDDGD